MVRRYDLDWLRVLLFALLVPHHVAVGFVDWGVDIYRFVNNQLAGDGMSLFIYWSHSWRLPSLFLISGIGTYFLTRRGIGFQFMAGRIGRLLIPAIFGFFVLNVFGGYAIAVMTDDPRRFISFWSDWLINPVPRQVQHLWFLFNLMIYTLLCWPTFSLREHLEKRSLSPVILILGLISVSALAVAIVKPYAAALAGNGYQFAYYLVFFAGGFMIGARHETVLGFAKRNVWILLAAAIALFMIKATLLALVLIADFPTGEALAAGGWVPLGLEPQYATVFSVIEALTAWAWCITALGLAAKFLNSPSSLVAELNRAVFPLYVLHFPITLVGLALIAQISWPWWIEFFLLLIVVYLFSWMLWRFADRLDVFRYLVGGRPATRIDNGA
ncbi:Acyltransferase family protein [Nitrosomonas marina]|uniref:Acyltransferase family protein n=1 Tax=Nitrosomonas marina TaxID=917 RepID=A0A1I0CVE0_9PROT|nr:acyltransferase family protein [Nitrosomonas marina]SET23531.1 Acyltransferase family protein [Nitrosomonas marina]